MVAAEILVSLLWWWSGASGEVRYSGPVVYTNLPPPLLYFPSFPAISKRGDAQRGRTEYVPFPYKDLPLLVYQSDRQPPVHVLEKPREAPRQLLSIGLSSEQQPARPPTPPPSGQQGSLPPGQQQRFVSLGLFPLDVPGMDPGQLYNIVAPARPEEPPPPPRQRVVPQRVVQAPPPPQASSGYQVISIDLSTLEQQQQQQKASEGEAYRHILIQIPPPHPSPTDDVPKGRPPGRAPTTAEGSVRHQSPPQAHRDPMVPSGSSLHYSAVLPDGSGPRGGKWASPPPLQSIAPKSVYDKRATPEEIRFIRAIAADLLREPTPPPPPPPPPVLWEEAVPPPYGGYRGLRRKLSSLIRGRSKMALRRQEEEEASPLPPIIVYKGVRPPLHVYGSRGDIEGGERWRPVDAESGGASLEEETHRFD